MVASKLVGKVEDGHGSAAGFVCLYSDKLSEKVGFLPFCGTLNVRLNSECELPTSQNRVIDSFVQDGKKYGAVFCYKARINSVECAVIIPERTSHKKDLIEVIAPFKLRDKLKLKTGDEVEIVLG